MVPPCAPDQFIQRQVVIADSCNGTPYTRVVSARWDDVAGRWEVTCDDGFVTTARWLLTAIGVLSIPVLPRLEGMDDFTGASFHTARWPAEGFCRVAVRVTSQNRRYVNFGTGMFGRVSWVAPACVPPS